MISFSCRIVKAGLYVQLALSVLSVLSGPLVLIQKRGENPCSHRVIHLIGSNPLELEPSRELERARSARSKRLPDTLVRKTESLRRYQVEAKVRNVTDVEDVEHLANQPQFEALV